MFGIIILVIIAAVILWGVGAYNGLIKIKNRVDEAWSDIDVQMKRRYDLIPNLVSTVKGYAKHESSVFEEVTEARAKATAINVDAGNLNAEDMAAFAAAQEGLTGALSKLLAVAENYPDLKANQNFLELQRELTDTENKIQASRRFYNGNVRDYNTKVETVPTNIIANIFNFAKREFFELEEDAAKEPVKVEF